MLTVPVSLDDVKAGKFEAVAKDFDEMHEQLFTFRLDAEKEFVNLRAIVLGPPSDVELSDTGEASSGSVDSDHYGS